MAVVVTGIGLVTALGGDARTTWRRLLAGQSAIACRQPFPDFPARPLAMLGKRPVKLRPLLRQAVRQALADAGLRPPLPDCGVIIGSSRSYQQDWEAFAAGQPCTHWLDTLPHMAAITTARQIGSLGPTLAPMAACATGLWCLAHGYEWIRTGRCDRILAGAAEAPITPLTLAGFEKMGALAQHGCYPFDQQRQGLVLGEGAAVLLLETAALAQQRQASIYGQLLGVGLTADGYHISSPDPTHGSSHTALATCLQRSQLPAQSIAWIHAHGTSTHLNDQTEAQLIQQCFPQRPAVSSTKGATGHTLGASGAIGTALSLLALRHQILPPCVGLQQPAFDLNLVRRATAASIPASLCLSFGFGGQNVALALASWPPSNG